MAGDGSIAEPSDDYSPNTHRPQIEIPRTWPVSILDRLVKDHSYWVGRGVREEVIAGFLGGVAVDGQLKGRYVLPIFNDNEEIIGFAGRALEDWREPRWKHLGKVSTWVWANLDEIRAQKRAILVEGAGCRLALETRGIHTSIPLWGTNLSPAVLGFLISANVERIDIATNRDVKHDVGQKTAEKVKSILDRFFDPTVARVNLPPAKDFLDESMTDEPFETWRKSLDTENNSEIME